MHGWGEAGVGVRIGVRGAEAEKPKASREVGNGEGERSPYFSKFT